MTSYIETVDAVSAATADERRSLRLRVRSRRSVSSTVMEIVLDDEGAEDLPGWEPGAHISVRVGDGSERQYSLCGDPADASAYRIAVQRDAAGRGGSVWMHDVLQVGDVVEAYGPLNNFILHPAPSYTLIAGGIGITPILSMARNLEAAGAEWRLTYLGRSRQSMAFLDELAVFGDRVTVHADDERGSCDLAGVVGDATTGTLVYACGPESLMRGIESTMAAWPGGALQVERFAPRPVDESVADSEFEVELAGSGEVFIVPPGESILTTLENAGKRPLSSCREGTCGTCESVIISGQADHRDSILSVDEQAANETMMICVSRSRSARLVLDL